jgi:methanogenic corrinoid protein MtbC1
MAGAELEDVIERIIRPTLIMVGQNWIDKKIDIADEHRMSFMVRSHMVFLETMIPELSVDAPLALLGCPTGEHHEIPLMIISLLLKKYGVRSEVLGINVPADDFASEILKTHPTYIGMSKLFVSNKLEEGFCMKVGSAAKKVKAKVLLGGAGWSSGEISGFLKCTKKVQVVTSANELKGAIA